MTYDGCQPRLRPKVGTTSLLSRAVIVLRPYPAIVSATMRLTIATCSGISTIIRLPSERFLTSSQPGTAAVMTSPDPRFADHTLFSRSDLVFDSSCALAMTASDMTSGVQSLSSFSREYSCRSNNVTIVTPALMRSRKRGRMSITASRDMRSRLSRIR